MRPNLGATLQVFDKLQFIEENRNKLKVRFAL